MKKDEFILLCLAFVVTVFGIAFIFRDAIERNLPDKVTVIGFSKHEKKPDFEEEDLVATIEREEDVISSSFNEKYLKIYKEVPFIYGVEASWEYGNGDMDEIRKQYVRRIHSPNWNGVLPAEVEIHIKEDWKNTPSQKKQLFGLAQLMKNNEVLHGTIIYNSAVNLSNIPSKWFVIGKKNYFEYKDAESQPLAYFEDINSVKDLEKTNVIYRGLVYNESPESSRFDGGSIK
ncbi:hypothetical protein [Rossellomorea marisflavi]|uniref:hypothetical protein n=1 Tax=Rossellomorea marisflavi TaxID=189381 RepID=UPI003F9FA94C